MTIATYSVKECLHGYTNEALGCMCERWQLAARTKDSRIRALERILSDGLHVSHAVREAPAAMARLLAILAAAPSARVPDGLAMPGLLRDEPRGAAFREALERGLVLVTPQDRTGAFAFGHLDRTNGAYDTAPALFIPEAVRSRVPAFPPLGVRLPTAEGQPVAALPPRREEAGAAFLDALRVIETVEPRVTARAEWHKKDAQQARTLIQESGLTAEAFDLALLMARQLGAVAAREGRLVTTSKSAQWAQSGRADRARDLFQAYLASEELADLRLFFPQLMETLEAKLPAGSLRRTYHRALVAQILREQPPGTWHPLQALADAVYRLDADVLFLDAPWRAPRRSARDLEPAWENHAWQAHERRLFTWIIQSLLARIGIVEISQDGAAFRVTPVGAYALDAGPAPEDIEDVAADAIVVQPDFEIVAYLDQCTPELRRRLDLFAERVSGGHVATYRLTSETAYRGARSGMPLSDFAAMLERHSRRPIPDNVRMQMESWNQRMEAVLVRRTCDVVECANAAQARALHHDTPGSRILGERFVLVATPLNGEVVRVDYSAPLRPCVEQQPGLTLRAPWERAHLFLAPRLADLCDLSGDGDGALIARLSPAKTRRIEDWSLVVAELEPLVIGPLAPRYRAAIRAWTGASRPAQTRAARLLRFDSPEDCEAVTQFPGVEACIEGRIGLFTLVVREGRLARLKRILKEHSMRVESGDSVADPLPPDQWLAQWAAATNSLEDHEPATAAPAAEEPVHSEIEAALPSYPARIVREILEDAILRRRGVILQYQSAWSQAPTVRRVNPITIDVASPSPGLHAYCHQQHATRLFRLARITGIRVLEDEHF